MAQYVAVANLKGGVGKSTIAVNLACALSSRSKRTVLVDADRQGTSTFWGASGALPVETWPLPLEDVGSANTGWLARVLTGSRSPEYERARTWLARLREIDASYVVVDCPPHVGLATRAAITAADLTVVPVTGTAADLAATSPAMRLIREVRQTRYDQGPDCLVVPSRIDRGTASGRKVEHLLRQFGEPLGPVISQRCAFADSLAFGQWVGDYAPGSRAYQEIASLALRVKRVLSRSSREQSQKRALAPSKH